MVTPWVPGLPDAAVHDGELHGSSDGGGIARLSEQAINDGSNSTAVRRRLLGVVGFPEIMLTLKSVFLPVALVMAMSLQFIAYPKNAPNELLQQASSQNVSAPTSPSNAETDLQRKLTTFTGWLVVVGFLQVFALIGQAILFWGTLGTMRDTAQRQLRAYMLPDQSGILDGTMLNPPQPAKANVPGCVMFMKNSGQTPAYKVVSFAGIVVLPLNSPNPQFVVPPIPTRFYNTIGAGGTFSKSLWFNRALTPQEVTDVINGVQAIFLYGRMEYEDIFKKHHVSNFRLQYMGQFPPPLGAIFNFSEEGNDAT